MSERKDAWATQATEMQALLDAGVDEKQADVVTTIRRDANESGEQIVRQAHSLIRELERLIEHVNDDLHVNSMGVVQSAGSQLDIACALYEERHTTARKVSYPFRSILDGE